MTDSPTSSRTSARKAALQAMKASAESSTGTANTSPRNFPNTRPLGRFPIDPWRVREIGLDKDAIAQTESVFALSNGHLGVRGNLDEGDPFGLPGTYLNSFFETRPLPYAEAGYGYPESGETVLNVTNGKLIRLQVDDEPLDLRYGEIISHERSLDLKRGCLDRTLVWESPAGTRIKLTSTRIVSLKRRSLLAIRYRVEPVDVDVRVVLQSELVANEPLPSQSGDPRVAAAMDNALEAVSQLGYDMRAMIMHRTRRSDLTMAAVMDHVIEEGHPTTELMIQDDWARVMLSQHLQVGEALELTKYVAYGWSSTRSDAALRDQVVAAAVSARAAGWDVVLKEHSEQFDEFWAGADVEIEGDDEIQQAVRFGMFHAYQAAARAEQRAIPAKGLTGPGYDGHAFWDTEMFVLPLLSATAPGAAADALRWRGRTLEAARDRAHTLRLRGATFPWRTISGGECSAYWPAGTAAFHVNSAVAAAVSRYWWWSDDDSFGRTYGLPILVHTARLWMSLGYHGDDGYFHLDGVTGPDEYSAIADDNTYTNLMAAQNLRSAVEAVAHLQADSADALHDLGVDADEVAAWTKAADTMFVPFNSDLDVHEQSRGFTLHEVWDFERSHRENEYPLLLHAPYFDLYRQQVIKQADLVLALHWSGWSFTQDEKARAFDYYDRITVRDSSLSACTQAVVAAEVGHLDLAYDYAIENALTDLHDLHGNTANGLHIASLAGSWLAVVAGFGGMRDHEDELLFRPQLPPGWERLRFTIRPRGQRLTVEITPGHVTYSAVGDAPVPLVHCTDGDKRERLQVKPGKSVKRKWTGVKPITPRPTQPAGREPHIRAGD